VVTSEPATEPDSEKSLPRGAKGKAPKKAAPKKAPPKKASRKKAPAKKEPAKAKEVGYTFDPSRPIPGLQNPTAQELQCKFSNVSVQDLQTTLSELGCANISLKSKEQLVKLCVAYAPLSKRFPDACTCTATEYSIHPSFLFLSNTVKSLPGGVPTVSSTHPGGQCSDAEVSLSTRSNNGEGGADKQSLSELSSLSSEIPRDRTNSSESDQDVPPDRPNTQNTTGSSRTKPALAEADQISLNIPPRLHGPENDHDSSNSSTVSTLRGHQTGRR
jgi:hypothetical protein